MFKRLIRDKKRELTRKQSLELENLRRKKPTDFWSFFKDRKKIVNSEISIDDFQKYFSELYKNIKTVNGPEAEVFVSTHDFKSEECSFDELNVPVSLQEVESAIIVTSNFGKLFSNILSTRVERWADSNIILSDAQFGFRKNCSTHDAIFILKT